MFYLMYRNWAFYFEKLSAGVASDFCLLPLLDVFIFICLFGSVCDVHLIIIITTTNVLLYLDEALKEKTAVQLHLNLNFNYVST